MIQQSSILIEFPPSTSPPQVFNKRSDVVQNSIRASIIRSPVKSPLTVEQTILESSFVAKSPVVKKQSTFALLLIVDEVSNEHDTLLLLLGLGLRDIR
jgi:hypothetical protein